MTTPWLEISAPLQEFRGDGDTLEPSPGLGVKRAWQKPDLRGLDATLGGDEQDKFLHAQHRLTFRWDEGTVPSPAETANLVLLVSWLVKPTKAHIAYRFQLGQDAAVISAPSLPAALERTDGQREPYFLSIQSGYAAPP